MTDRIEKQESVVNRIIDGSISIDSVEEFEDLLKAFPNDPRLHRVFADLLLEKNSIHAQEIYDISSSLFLKEGLPLQAVVSKIIEWRINKPTEEERLAFHNDMGECNTQSIASHEFFTRLSPVELFDIMANVGLHTFNKNTRLKKFGDEENELCFIISGSLEETHFHRPDMDGKIQKKNTSNLIESDIFGHVFPFEENKISESQIESITRTEILKISKIKLTALCKEHPNIGTQVQLLCNTFFHPNHEMYSKAIRKATRHQLPTQVTLKIFQPDKTKPAITFAGFTEDISPEGACVVLGAAYHTGDVTQLTGLTVKIQMSLSIESISLNILGSIVWGKEITMEGKRTSIVGIKFKDINPVDLKILNGYCLGSEAEQNLIWSLWSSLLKDGL